MYGKMQQYLQNELAAIKEAAPGLMIEYKLPIVTENEDGSLRGKGGLVEAEGVEFVDGRVDMEKFQWNQVTLDMKI